jgi:aminopeptidase N
LHLTVPTGMVGASSGLLVSTVVNPDGTRTFTWEESHPIATYLVNANVTNYAEFSDSYTSLDGNTVMPIDYYVYPEDQALAQQNFTAVPEMIHFFASLTGEYPYLDEKFGQVEVNYPGMEHPTLTAVSQRWTRGDGSYPPGDATLMYAHELAHHWWGDDVTCGSWHDVWLNEGFATYFEALWWAHTQGISEGEAFHWYDIDGQYNGAFEGTVYVKNENKPFKDEMAVYYKGAWVLHMLKKVMGEDHFYEALRHYRTLHHYGSATTDDFRAACEDIYGQSLQWFFDQWVFTPKRPVYKMWVALAPGNCVVTLDQVQHHKIAHRTGSDAKVYRMPVDLTLHFDDGTSETHTVWNDQRAQTFSFPVTRVVTSVGFDEDGWLLKVVR